MPRPNPPRKRQRRRNPNAVVKVPQQARDQETDAATPEATPPPPRSARAALRAGAPAPAALDTSEWTRRSLYVLVALMAVTQAFVNVLIYTFSKSGISFGNYVAILNPYALLASGYIAMPVAKRITREPRYLRPVETAVVAIFVFFLWYFFVTAAAALVQGVGPTSNNTARPTPCPVQATTCSTPAPTQTPFATAQATAGSSAGASPSASASVITTQKLTAKDYTALGAAEFLAFATTPLIFYPVYRRFRFKRRLTQPPASRGSPGGRRR